MLTSTSPSLHLVIITIITIIIIILDIPGLIDGASENKGLGHDFLKHIERTKMLCYIIDGASTEGRCPLQDLQSLMTELQLYDRKLLDKPGLVDVNKKDINKKFSLYENDMKEICGKIGLPCVTGSAAMKKGISELAMTLKVISDEIKQKEMKALEKMYKDDKGSDDDDDDDSDDDDDDA